MYRSSVILTIFILVMLAAACAPVVVTPTPAPILTEEPAIPVTGAALVQSVEIQVLGTDNLQVNAILRGQLPDAGCTKITSVNQVREGDTLVLTVNTTTDPVALCAQALTPFEQVVALDVSGMQPGTYSIQVNGLSQSFVIPIRDRARFNQSLLEALNARDYGGLKRLMGQSFLIGYWQSEGTTNSPDQAVEQLQRSLLSSTTPIAADPNKDLVALLGADPANLLGPEVIEPAPLFTSGWGAQGRDEVILFIARQPDGNLYWHGLLFARDGFARPTPVAPTQPVDMNAYPTGVKFILAQQDVRMRNGPGTQFGIIGFVAAGQTAKVTGVSADRNWWQVICPDNRVGSCWISAATNLTKPSNGPVPDDTTYPTDVKFVTALKDVNIYIGPGTQFNVVGLVAAGETAQVLGVNADKSWWQIPCLADEVKCWISADPKLTKPVDTTAPADVQSVEVQILESYPVQVNAIARGMLPDSGCTKIGGAKQVRSGNTFTVTVTTKRDPLALCAQMLTPFEYSLPLDVSSLLPGRYNVNINGVIASFDLPVSSNPTGVQYVMALQDISIYSGPGSQNSVIGSVAGGQTAKVTGVSADGSWWRVICPDDTAGSCWVSADPALTQPANAPGS